MGREEPSVKLHALDDVYSCLGLLAFFDGDHAILTNLEKRLGQHISDRGIVVASDRGNLHQFLLVFLVDWRGH